MSDDEDQLMTEQLYDAGWFYCIGTDPADPDPNHTHHEWSNEDGWVLASGVLDHIFMSNLQLKTGLRSLTRAAYENWVAHKCPNGGTYDPKEGTLHKSNHTYETEEEEE